MTTPTANNIDALITAALADDDCCDFAWLVWWAQDELGLNADPLLVSDRAILDRCSTVADFLKARRAGCAIRIGRRDRVALWALYRCLPTYRRWQRASDGTSADRFAPDFSC